MKLTTPQLYLLRDCNVTPQYVASSYPPAKSLVSKGLCEWKPGKTRDILHITAKGKEYLEGKE